MKLKIIGHGGAAGHAEANTLESIKKALRYKVDMIELDVRSTIDKKIVLFHDPRFEGKPVNKMTYKEFFDKKPNLATLEGALSIIPEKMPVNIEIKPGCDVESLLKIIKKSKRNENNLLLSSFSFQILKQVREIMPNIPIAVLEMFSGVRASYRANQLGTKRLHFEQHVIWSLFIKMMSDQGWEVYAFTVDNPKRAKSFAKSGLKGIFTNYPDRFK